VNPEEDGTLPATEKLTGVLITHLPSSINYLCFFTLGTSFQLKLGGDMKQTEAGRVGDGRIVDEVMSVFDRQPVGDFGSNLYSSRPFGNILFYAIRIQERSLTGTRQPCIFGS
jgi:hypothetical protein